MGRGQTRGGGLSARRVPLPLSFFLPGQSTNVRLASPGPGPAGPHVSTSCCCWWLLHGPTPCDPEGCEPNGPGEERPPLPPACVCLDGGVRNWVSGKATDRRGSVVQSLQLHAAHDGSGLGGPDGVARGAPFGPSQLQIGCARVTVPVKRGGHQPASLLCH